MTHKRFLPIFKEDVFMAQVYTKAGPFQKPLLILGFALLLVVAAVFIPHPVAANADEIQDLRISYEGTPIQNFNEEAVKEFLGQLSCHRSLGQHTPYSLDDTYEFDMIYQSKPLHVVLGEKQFCYSSAGMFKEFTISNGSAAIDRLEYILSH